MRQQTKQTLGVMLLEVMVSLLLVSLTLPVLLAVIHDSLSESSSIVVIRRARLLAQAKMSELVQGIERDSSGTFKDENEDTIIGFEWSAERTPVDFWPNPNDTPELEENRELNVLEDADKDALITLLEIKLTVTFPGQETIRNVDGEAGKGIILTMYRIPDDDDVRDLNLDYR